MGLGQRPETLLRDLDETFGPPSALRGRFSHAGREETLLFKAFQGRIKSSGRRIPASAGYDLILYRDTIGLVPEPECREKNHLFKLTKYAGVAQYSTK